MTKVTDDLFDKAVNEVSFAIPRTPKENKTNGDKHPLVEGKYYGHITKVTSKVVDVSGGEYKARVYDYFIEVAPENKDNKYSYKKYDSDETVECDGGSYIGYKFKGSIFKYLEPSKDDKFKPRTENNKYFLWFCEACGLECPTVTAKIDGEEMEVKSLPALNTEELIGVPVSAFVAKGKTWKDSEGKERTPWVAKWLNAWENGKKREMTDADIPF